MTITITALPAQGTVYDTTLIPVETGGTTGHIAATAIKNYVSTGTLTSVTATTGTFDSAGVGGALTAGSISAGFIQSTGDLLISGNLHVIGIDTFDGNIYGNIVGNVISPTVGGNIFVGNVTAYVVYPNQPYITNMGNITLNNLIANANISAGNLSTTSKITVGGSIMPTSNAAAVNIGSTSTWFNNIYGTAVHALYADLAERYTSDAQYNPGTVVVFGTDTEVTASYQPNDIRVAGVVSTNPAYTMNAGIDGVDVALQGRVPCQVTGEVRRGDLMVTSAIPGVAMANNSPAIGSVIGKALGSHTGSGVSLIEVVVGRI